MSAEPRSCAEDGLHQRESSIDASRVCHSYFAGIYDVSPKKILEANTTKKLVNLSISSGIVDVPDEWTLERLVTEKKQRQAEEHYKKTHLSVTRSR
jgi:hypothetical protein